MIIGGEARVPGDKSITHRALLLASLARGTSRITGALASLDARSTARVLRELGAEVSPLAAGRMVTIRGRARYRRPRTPLHCGNSGTSARLLLGILAAHPFAATLTGDASLRRRPMRRVTDPLERMGARFSYRGSDGLPVTVHGGALAPLRWELPVSSTERMLRHFGFAIEDDGDWIRFEPTGRLEAADWLVPGDPSSAAFLVGAGLLAEGGSLRLRDIGLNPTRTGFLRVLTRMGAHIAVEDLRDAGGEPVGDLLVAPSPLRATEVAPAEVPGLIDEVPLLSVLASRAEGTTIFHEVGELRVKESDRLALLAANLRALGTRAEAHGNALWVEGSARPPVGRVVTAGDHRLAMAFAVLGTLPGARVRVDNPGSAAVSFPGFHASLRALRGARKGRA